MSAIFIEKAQLRIKMKYKPCREEYIIVIKTDLYRKEYSLVNEYIILIEENVT